METGNSLTADRGKQDVGRNDGKKGKELVKEQKNWYNCNRINKNKSKK